MPFDIYGQSLERGHCEVHPHVHMEYPCMICLQQADADHQMKNEQDRLEREHYDEMEREYYEEIELQVQIQDEDAELYWKDGE